MKIGFTGDIHVDKNKNLPFIIDCCKWIGDECVRQGIKLLIVAGDFANNRYRLDVYALNKMLDIVSYWNDLGLSIVFLLGNHELYHNQNLVEENEITSIKVFKKHCKVVERFECVEIAKTHLFFVPWMENKELFVETINQCTNSLDKDTHAILISHQELKGSIMNDLAHTCDTTGIDTAILEPFDMCFFGHYHTRQRVSHNVWYLGSPVMLNFGDGIEPKGLTMYDTKTREVGFAEYPQYMKYITLPNDINYINELIEKKQFEVSRFVRIMDNIDQGQKTELTNLLIEHGALDVVFQPSKAEKTSVDICIDSYKNLHEIIQEFVGKNTNTLDKERLVNTANELMEME